MNKDKRSSSLINTLPAKRLREVSDHHEGKLHFIVSITKRSVK